MKQTLLLGDVSIAVTRKRIKHLHLRVHPPDGRVTMSAPYSMRLHTVESFAATRLDWIRRQQERLRRQEWEAPQRALDIEDDKRVLHGLLPPLIEKWEQRLTVRLNGYSLRRMKTRWGTCNYRTRHIRLNTELATKSPHLIEYVVVHEMMHLFVPNHGPRFVALMNEHYPSWREARAELHQASFTPA
jgi:predicted metal-dependent hydrolase